MKQILLTLAVAAAATLPMFGESTVLYQSDFYNGSTIDSGWEVKNMINRGGVKWESGDSSDLLGLEANGCAKKPYNYEQSVTADTWLISPAIKLEAGKEYTISIMARTNPTTRLDEVEDFRVNVATSPEVADLKAGAILIEKTSYENKGDFEKFESTYIPSETGDFYFGVQCFSAKDMDTLWVTRFTVEGEPAEEGEDPIEEVVAKELPYSFDFSDEDVFKSEWKSVAGADATVTNLSWTWSSLGAVNWDHTNGSKEDNWLISPALKVEEVGTYLIDNRMWINGNLEVLIGTDISDLSTFKVVKTYESNDYPDDDEIDRISTSIDAPGNYYIAFRACSEKGTYMGHRIFYMGFKQLLTTPGIATNLKAIANVNDELSVDLSWKYPVKTNTDEALSSITKAEIYRGDELIHTIENPEVGSIGAYTDSSITSEGVYTYKIIVFGEYGYDTDREPATATTNYVGHPTMEFPVDWSIKVADAPMFTIIDNNEDGLTWKPGTGWTFSFDSVNESKTAEMDDYICTPYVNLPVGYYRLTMAVGAANNTAEVGYTTNRHNPADNFVKLGEVVNTTSSLTSDHDFIVNVREAGEYSFVVRHVGGLINASSSYNKVVFDEIVLESQLSLPGVAEDLKAEAATDNSLAATITWRNPTKDNAGEALAAVSYALVYRDNEQIGKVENGLVPGEESLFIDEKLTNAGEYTYKVEVWNENGKSEEKAPEVSVFVGPGITEDYTTSTFEDWKLQHTNDWYKWGLNDDNEFEYDNRYSSDKEAYASSPYLEFEAGSKYEINIETKGGGDLAVHLLNGQDYEVAGHSKLGDIIPHSENDKIHTYTLLAVDPATPAALAEEASSAINVPAGKNVFSLHVDGNGTVQVKSFSVANKGVESGVQTVYAVAGMLKYADGKVVASEACDIVAYTLDGQKVAAVKNATELDLSAFAGETLIISAVKDDKKSTLKVRI